MLAHVGVDRLRFPISVTADESLTTTVTAKLITPRRSAEYGEVRWGAVLANQDSEPVATYGVLTLVAELEEI